MPRVRTLGVPAKQKELEERLKAEFGNMLTAADVGKFLCIKSQRIYNKFLEGVPAHTVVGRTKYFADDVAKKLYEDSL